MPMRSNLPLVAAAWAGILLVIFLAGCSPQYEATTAHPNPILIREFAFSPGIVTLDPSFGFSLYRGEQGVPREQRAAGLGRAVAFNLTDAMARVADRPRLRRAAIRNGCGRARHARADRQRHRFAGSTRDSAGGSGPRTAASRSMSRSTIRFTDRRRSGLPRSSSIRGRSAAVWSACRRERRGDVKIAAEPARRRTRSLYRRGRAQPEWPPADANRPGADRRRLLAGSRENMRAGARARRGPYSSPSALSMRTVLRIAATVSSSSASPCVAEMTPPGWLLRSTPLIIMPSRILCTMSAVRSLFSAANECSSGSNLVGVIGARSGFVNNSSEENVP